MDTASIIGYFAGAITTIAFIPQVIKIWKTKSTKDISLITFVAFCLGVFLWMIYGIILHSKPVIIANSIGFVLGIIIIILKIKYK
jgi:MtN3 and saliva related transmembrane protein